MIQNMHTAMINVFLILFIMAVCVIFSLVNIIIVINIEYRVVDEFTYVFVLPELTNIVIIMYVCVCVC